MNNEVKQNLKDSGCCEEFIKEFLKLKEEGRTEELNELINQHRKKLLEGVHCEQKKIDCFDYLIYSLRKKGSNE